MGNGKRIILACGLVASVLGAGVSARAQENGATAIGPPQLRDFQIQPKERIVTQPAPEPAQRPVAEPPPPPVAAQRQPARTGDDTARATPAVPAQRGTPPAEPRIETPAPSGPAPALDLTFPPAVAEAPAEPPAPPAAESTVEAQGRSYWLYALPAAALALLGVAVVRRRRRSAAKAPAEPEPAQPAPPRPPRPDPVPRPWLELELKTERASFADAEAVVEFELTVANTGGSSARNLRIDVKMFNAGAEQDKEIGAFFRTAGRESTKLNLPGIEPGATGLVRGEVAMPREEIRAMQLDERLLFIPVVAVNALYDWGENRTGQTSKSYVVGRELQQPSEKMGAFRVDQGPRVWRTVGQRPHKLAKRV